jgi:C-terminal region of peptidase_M24
MGDMHKVDILHSMKARGCGQHQLRLSAQVLSKSEVAWINDYHKEVWDSVSPRVSGETLEWLRANTMPLEVPVAAEVAAS